jgi:hypothetical protein
MTQILLDANTARRLKASTNAMELCSPDGEVVGLFTPIKKPTITVPFSEDEIRKSKEKGGGRPLADILSELEKS